jgi:hypothetical protein
VRLWVLVAVVLLSGATHVEYHAYTREEERSYAIGVQDALGGVAIVLARGYGAKELVVAMQHLSGMVETDYWFALRDRVEPLMSHAIAGQIYAQIFR